MFHHHHHHQYATATAKMPDAAIVTTDDLPRVLFPVMAAMFIIGTVLGPALFLVQQNPDLPHVEVTETFWKFVATSGGDQAVPFNATTCIVYEHDANATKVACVPAPLNPNEFSKVGNYFIAHTECRLAHTQTVIAGRCNVLKVEPHTVNPRLVMHGRHHGSMFCQWFLNKHTVELIVAVEVTCV